MGINKNKFALALAATMAVLYVICAAFTAIAPELALKVLGWVIHLVNLEKATEVSITFGGFIVGLIPIFFYSYAGGWIFASFYNRFQLKK
ncbi:MAG: hypothetical protein HYT13_03315 [Candidatus Liptonbacteria bacterium]|nr:hypothetical protein [Candidatus Liptonbacteria bacterium]